MSPPIKELEPPKQPSAESASPSPATRPGAGRPGADRVCLEIPVRIRGSRAGAYPSGTYSSGAGQSESFSEETRTLIVFPNGAVLRLSASVVPGQMLAVTNEQNHQEVLCKVMNVRTYPNAQGYVEVVFSQKASGFWGVRFPSDAATPASGPAVSPAANASALGGATGSAAPADSLLPSMAPLSGASSGASGAIGAPTALPAVKQSDTPALNEPSLLRPAPMPPLAGPRPEPTSLSSALPAPDNSQSSLAPANNSSPSPEDRIAAPAPTEILLSPATKLPSPVPENLPQFSDSLLPWAGSGDPLFPLGNPGLAQSTAPASVEAPAANQPQPATPAAVLPSTSSASPQVTKPGPAAPASQPPAIQPAIQPPTTQQLPSELFRSILRESGIDASRYTRAAEPPAAKSPLPSQPEKTPLEAPSLVAPESSPATAVAANPAAPGENIEPPATSDVWGLVPSSSLELAPALAAQKPAVIAWDDAAPLALSNPAASVTASALSATTTEPKTERFTEKLRVSEPSRDALDLHATLDRHAPRQHPRPKHNYVLAGAVAAAVVLVAAAVFSFLQRSPAGVKLAAPAASAAQPALSSPAPPVSETTNTQGPLDSAPIAASPEASVTPAPASSRTAAKQKPVPHTALPTPAKQPEASSKTGPPVTKPAGTTPSVFALAKSASAAPPERTTVAKETPAPPSISAMTPAATAAPMGIISESGPAQPPASAVPSAEKPATRLGGIVVSPHLVSSALPIYPGIAQMNHVEGDVVVQAEVDASGRVSSTKIISGPTMLRQAAMDAVRRWRYKPGTLDGQPVASHVLVTLKFKLPI